MRLGRQTITVLEPPDDATDDWGNRITDWDHATDTDIPHCDVQPDEQGVELVDGESTVITLLRVWAPPSIVVTARNRIRYDGVLYEIDGPPGRYTGRGAHVTLRLQLIDPRWEKPA